MSFDAWRCNRRGRSWVGFIGGALLGGIADVVLATGGALAVLGHGGAIAGAIAAEARGG